jgi:hypothetical protein
MSHDLFHDVPIISHLCCDTSCFQHETYAHLIKEHNYITMHITQDVHDQSKWGHKEHAWQGYNLFEWTTPLL